MSQERFSTIYAIHTNEKLDWCSYIFQKFVKQVQDFKMHSVGGSFSPKVGASFGLRVLCILKHLGIEFTGKNVTKSMFFKAFGVKIAAAAEDESSSDEGEIEGNAPDGAEEVVLVSRAATRKVRSKKVEVASKKRVSRDEVEGLIATESSDDIQATEVPAEEVTQTQQPESSRRRF